MVLGTEAPALGQSADDVVAEQQAVFAALQAGYTGSGLDAAVAATLAGTVQVTGFAPLATSTGAASEDFSLTFSAPVTGLTTANFAVSAGPGLLRSAVTSITPVAGSGGTAYTVAVSTGVGQGTLTLGFNPDGLTGADGSPLTGGSFTPVQTYASPATDGSGYATGLAVGDFNGDGRLDVAQAVDGGADSTGSVTLFLGQGDGTFVAQPSVYAGPLTPGALVAGDFNGDGKLDVVTLEQGVTVDEGSGAAGEHDVAVLLGSGNGTFGQPIQTEVGTTPPLELTTGDFNGDGKPDLAVLVASATGYGTDATVQIYLGNGNGTFTAGGAVDAGDAAYTNYASSIAEADLNGDGDADIVVGTVGKLSLTPSVSVLLGDGHGGFTLAAQPTLTFSDDNSGGSLVAVGDLNGDGIPDLVVLPSYPADAADANGAIPATLDVLLGRGDGTFAPATSVVLPLPPVYAGEIESADDLNLNVAIGDVTGDGKPDIVVNNQVYGDIVLPGLGNGSFGPGTFTTADQGQSYGGSSLALADVNGDGRLDLLTSSDGSEAGSSLGLGIGVALNTAQTVLPASATVTVSRPAVAQPTLSKASGAGTLTQTGTAYTLNLGALPEGASSSVALALANIAAAPADSFDGLFSAPAGSGFAVSGANLPQAVAAGGSYAGLSFAADTSAPGTYSETIIFAPRDVTDDPAATLAVPAGAAEGDITTYTQAAAAPNPDDVALELSPITLTVTDTVLASGTSLAPAALAPVSPVTLPNARVGAADTAALTVINAATAPAAGLDVTAAASGAASVSGAITGLAAGSTDAADLIAGLGTASAGALSGIVTLAPVSDAGGVTTPLAAVAVPVSGSVFRSAAAQIAPVRAILHVGDPGTVALSVANRDQADGFSESLIAGIASVTPGLTIAAGGPTGDIAPGATNQALAVGVATAAAGTVSGTATLGLTSDGSGVDGLGTLALAPVAVPITVTVDNTAQATLAATGATLSGSTAAGYILNLGAVQQGGAAVTATLDTVNSAAGPVDALSGSYAVASAPGFSDSGFTAFSGDGAGQADAGGAVTLQTGQAGTFSQTIVLHATGSNASGYSGALADQTVTVEGTVTPPGPAIGTPVTTPGTLTVAPDQGATALGIQSPTDPNYATTALAATITALPTDGAIDLADGTTPISLGQVLGIAQLTSLVFLPARGVSSTQSNFSYAVADPAGNASAGSFTLAIGGGAGGSSSTGTSATLGAPPPPVLSPGNLLSDVPTPAVSGTALAGSLVTLLSNGSAIATATASAAGAFTAVPVAPLPLGPNVLTATATTSGGVSAASAPVDLFETPDQVNGVSIPDNSTRDVVNTLGQSFGLELTSGTQQVQLLDGTISVAPGTNEAYLARLYEGLFGRSPDPATGYADDQFAMGLTHVQIATEFLASPEGQADFAGSTDSALISSFAQGLLGRSFSAGDQSALMTLLGNGTARGAVLASIADSAEAQAHLSPATSDVFHTAPNGSRGL